MGPQDTHQPTHCRLLFKNTGCGVRRDSGFHQLDVMAFVRRWMADGHLSAVTKGAGARAREVLDRKASEHKVSFLA